MNRPDIHPDSEQLDRLRAGLLDDDPELKTDISRHLAHCAACRRRHDWSGQLHPGKLALDTPTAQLDRIRRQAIGRRAPRLLPFAIAAALALVAVLLVKPALQEQQPDTQLAQKPSPEATPVLYEDLDFYLWLADHKEIQDSTS